MSKEQRKLVISNEEVFNILKEGKKAKIKIKGSSMLPFIVGGRDYITLAKVEDATFRKGRIVVARINVNTYFLHRIERIEGEHVVLRGDGNPYLREECPVSAVLAEAVEIERKGKRIVLGSPVWNAFRILWPSNPLLRRIFLKIYRIL